MQRDSQIQEHFYDRGRLTRVKREEPGVDQPDTEIAYYPNGYVRTVTTLAGASSAVPVFVKDFTYDGRGLVATPPARRSRPRARTRSTTTCSAGTTD